MSYFLAVRYADHETTEGPFDSRALAEREARSLRESPGSEVLGVALEDADGDAVRPMVRQRTGLRPMGERRRSRLWGVGESRAAAIGAEVGDAFEFEMVQNMTDPGLDRFAAALNARGLDFGEVSEKGPTEHEPEAWIVYPVGDPSAVFP